ncbi:copper homeostasis protein [Pullulanibacillus pueri]|uniref:PF03932 family protein CutC n=1 Tax=Pullulanibacillus pueri TaxID=1437324 RepID=A0A8J3EMD9_9BACL|nr:copper homeostasis protein CutC [Pullulanibacillus pueri]MBM7682043.1 copper homeostasis protein [Pullulanibacillus pueri]GGH80197.1 copper homeostasis protein CutC [Pullulanibacillus pueri]
MIIEVIVQNSEDAKRAEQAGARRLELVSAISEGGLTPSYGAIKQVIEAVNIPVYVMLRPHSDHFCYRSSDWAIIEEDVMVIRDLGASGIVFGCLNPYQEIDEPGLSHVIDLAGELGITFHRAFDEVENQVKAFETLCHYSESIERVLTSGGAQRAEEGVSQLQQLQLLSRKLSGPEILVGSGLNAHNISGIHQRVKASEYHFGSGVRVHNSFRSPIDVAQIQMIRKKLEMKNSESAS